MKERLSQPLRSRTSSRNDTTDSNGQQLLRQQVGSSGRNSPLDGVNKLEKSPESFKDRLIQDTPIRELWNMAYEKLREQDSALIADYEAKLTGSVTAGLGQAFNLKQNRGEWMQAILESKMEEFNRDKSKPQSSSSKVQAESAMRLVLRVANSANDYISNVTSANPCTSIAWAGVSFFLPLLMNIAAEQTSLVKGLEYIASLIVQSRMKEELYVECYELGTHNHKRFRESHSQYKTALKRLYVYILRFQATACCYYSNSSILRHGLDALKWKDWASLVDEIREQERNFAAVEEMWRDIQRYEKHLTTISTFSEMNAKLSALADKEFADLLRWLCDVDPSSMYNAGLDRREAGTCEWLIKDSEEFKSWEASDGSLLWLHGKAGSGKSILSSSVIKYLRDQYVTGPSTVVSYFYFSFSDPEKQKVDVMLASLTKQICARQTKRSQLMERLGQYKSSGQRPDTETLEAVLIASASEFANVYIVIDALDECPLFNEQRAKLLKSLRRILAIAPNKFHFFFTSRKEPDIDDKIRPILSSTDKNEIDLLARQQTIDRDINHYIDSQLNGEEYKSWPKSVKEKARELLVEKADCMFQYVQLQLEALRHLSSEPEVREALQNLPTGLDATYNRVLGSIPPHFQERVIHSLKWLAFSREVLYIEELAEIFTIRPHEDIPFNENERPFSPTHILQYFSGLIIAQEGSSWWHSRGTQIRLVHFSLKEYLVSRRITQGPTLAFSFTEVNAQLSIVRSCLAYLNHLNHWVASHTAKRLDHETMVKSYPLARYAARNWMHHLEEIPRSSWSPDIEREAASALSVHSQSLLTLFIASGSDVYYTMKPYYYTAKHGHLQLTKMLIYQKSGPNKYVTREELEESLEQMANEGGTDAIQVFLDAGADVNAQCSQWGSALQAAAAGGRLGALKLLVSCGANVNSSSSNDTGLLTRIPEDATDCLQFLLDSGADIDMQDGDRGTALHSAVMNGYEANIDLLLQRGANVNALAHHGTPLQAVCKSRQPCYALNGPREIARSVKKLLENGADANLKGGKSDTALVLACDNQALFPNRQVAMEIIQLLVKNETVESGIIIHGYVINEAKIRERHHTSWEPYRSREMCCPITRSAVEVVKLLLENGATIDESLATHMEEVYSEELHFACIERDETRVRWLLDQGADVNATSFSFGTPLHAVLTYVMSNGRPVTSYAGHSKNIIEETIPIVQLLISKGAQVNHIGGEYGTAFQAACFSGAPNMEMVRFLLEHGADVNAEGGFYGTVLTDACASQQVDLARLLLEYGADANAKGGYYGTALITACASNREVDLIRLLLEHGADVNAEGGEFVTVLAATCERGNIALVRLLLEYGANIHQQDYAAWNAAPRMSQYQGDVIEVLKLFFDQVTNINHRNRGLATALNATLEIWITDVEEKEKKRQERICWLLRHGADVNFKGGKYGFALQTVCAREFSDIEPNDINAISRTTKFLLEQCPSINVNTQGGIFGSALQAAAFSGQTESVRLLLDRGADIDARGGKCASALNAAILRGHWDIVEILLQAGATPDYLLQQQPDEEWLQRLQEDWPNYFLENGARCAIARYRKFWEVESGSAAETE